jgi:arsenate reductase (thioredoxin)
MATIRVLFLCSGNSARSQMAEALLRKLGGKKFEAHSAGLEPKGMNPLTVEALEEIGLDAGGQNSKSLQVYLGQKFAHVITVCDHANEKCPAWPGNSQRHHWGFEDPAAVKGTHDEQLNAFRRIRDEIAERIKLWLQELAGAQANSA